MNNQQKDERIAIVRDCKLSKEKIDEFQKRYNQLSEIQVVEEVLPNGEAKIGTDSLLIQLLEFTKLGIAMELEFMKNSLAAYLEHNLEKEVMDIQMQERISSMMKKFGMDSDSFKNMFGGSGNR